MATITWSGLSFILGVAAGVFGGHRGRGLGSQLEVGAALHAAFELGNNDLGDLGLLPVRV